MLITGEKQIGVNQNVDVLRFSGQVDPRAIQPGNTVASAQIANVRIDHRGKGAQGAMLAARISHAAKLGCESLVTETGEQRDDRPSNSYRNILRLGFEEVAVTANWLGRS